MASINLSIAHRHLQEEALRRVKSLLTSVKERYRNEVDDLRETWSGSSCRFSFSARGYQISGSLRVTPSYVQLEGPLPFMLGFFKGTIEDMIREEAQKILA